jgi:hypothetical protein
MNSDRREFLNLSHLPARLSLGEAAWLLGFTEHDISVLVAAGLLKPLGRPPSSGSKYFSTCELQQLRADARWLGKASDATVNYWRKKNAGRIKMGKGSVQLVVSTDGD